MRTAERDARAAADAGPIVDAHTHFFPFRMSRAVWRFFEERNWPMPHQKPPEALARDLAAAGVSHYTLLNYVKREGQAAALNAWTAEFAAAHPEALPFGTVHALDPDPLATVEPYLDRFLGVKIQPLVCEFGVDDPRLEPVLARLCALDKILLAHAGTAPYPNAWVGLERLERALARFPELRVIVAHMGAYEVERAFALLVRYPRVCLDTAMIFTRTDLFPRDPAPSPESIERYSNRILFGSDYPNIPYPYAEAVASIVRLPVSPEAKRRILYDNAAAVFGIGPAASKEAACSG